MQELSEDINAQDDRSAGETIVAVDIKLMEVWSWLSLSIDSSKSKQEAEVLLSVISLITSSTRSNDPDNFQIMWVFIENTSLCMYLYVKLDRDDVCFPSRAEIIHSTSQIFRSWVAIFQTRPSMASLFRSLYDMPGLAPRMNVLSLGRSDFQISFSNRDTSRNAWNRHWGSFMVDTRILSNNMKFPSHKC